MHYVNNLVIVVCAFQVGFSLSGWLTRNLPTPTAGAVRYTRWMRTVSLGCAVALCGLWVLGADRRLVLPILGAQLLVTGFWFMALRAARRQDQEAWAAPLPGSTR